MINYDKIRDFAAKKLWKKNQVKDAVTKGIITLGQMISIFQEYFNDEITSNEIIEYARSAKISEMSENCNERITNGCDIELSDGESHHFSLTTQDQLNLISLSGLIASGQATAIPYHADGELCKSYSVFDITTIINAATSFKTYNITYFNALKAYIKTMTDINIINTVEYGMEIPEEYQSDVLKELIENMPSDEDSE